MYQLEQLLYSIIDGSIVTWGSQHSLPQKSKLRFIIDDKTVLIVTSELGGEIRLSLYSFTILPDIELSSLLIERQYILNFLIHISHLAENLNNMPNLDVIHQALKFKSKDYPISLNNEYLPNYLKVNMPQIKLYLGNYCIEHFIDEKSTYKFFVVPENINSYPYLKSLVPQSFMPALANPFNAVGKFIKQLRECKNKKVKCLTNMWHFENSLNRKNNFIQIKI